MELESAVMVVLDHSQEEVAGEAALEPRAAVRAALVATVQPLLNGNNDEKTNCRSVALRICGRPPPEEKP